MLILRETTVWKDSTPNHTYLVDNRRCQLLGFVAVDQTEIKWYDGYRKFDARGRDFQVLKKLKDPVDQHDDLSYYVLTESTLRETNTMETKQLTAIYKGLLNKADGDIELATEQFTEKYPEYIGELQLIQSGEAELAAELKVKADEAADKALLETPDDEAVDLEVEPVAEKPAKAPKAEKVKAPKAEKQPKAPKAPKAPSKAQLAREIYAAAVDKSRKVVTKMFIDQLGLTPAGASTYYQSIVSAEKKAA